jgi:hypothetical protein
VVTHFWVWLLHIQEVAEIHSGACTKPQRPRMFTYPNMALDPHLTRGAAESQKQEENLFWNKNAC